MTRTGAASHDHRQRTVVRRYVKFVAVAALSAGVIVCLGYFPTVRLAGEAAAWSMFWGCGVSWVASCVGAIPTARALSGGSSQPALAILTSTGLRFVTVLLLVAPLVLSGWINRNVFAIWVAISYMLMLVVDTTFAIHTMRSLAEND